MKNKYIKKDWEIKKMRVAGKVLRETKQVLKTKIVPGMNLLILDKIAKDTIERYGCVACFKGYQGFPNSICISLNNELIHGIPKKYYLKKGDMISIDLGCSYEGYNVDCAFTVVCGGATNKQLEIINITKEALDKAINGIKANIRVRDVSKIIEDHITSKGYFLTPDYTGHGIGKDLHEKPYIPNIASEASSELLPENTTIAIEPMVLENSNLTYIGDDGWTVYPEDSGLTCHFEETILITKNGCEVLT